MATNDTTARPTDAAPRTAPAAAAAPAPRAAARAPRAPRAAARARGAARARRAPRARARRAARRSTRTTVGTTREAVAVTPIAQAQQLAERAVLIPLGVALEARDLVTDAVDTLVANSTDALDGFRSATSSRRALDRQLKRFERRGGRARSELERDLRRTRTRLEREVRHSRVRAERQAREARRGFAHQRAEARRVLDSRVGELQGRVKPLGQRVAPVRDRVENVVQNGYSAGKRLVGSAQGRFAKDA
jgi:hypothetical protein